MTDWVQRPIPPELAHVIEPRTRLYQRAADDGVGHLSVLVSHSDRWHLSISHRQNLLNMRGDHMPGRYPTWDEIAEARYKFVPDHVTMALLLPPRAEYVNLMPTCFHLWEVPTDADDARPRPA